MTSNLVIPQLNRPFFFAEIRWPEYPTCSIPISSVLLAGSTGPCSSYITSCIRSSMYNLDSPIGEYLGDCIASFACGVVKNHGVLGFYILVEVEMIGSDDEEKMIRSDVGGGEVCAVFFYDLSGRVEIAGLPCSHMFHRRCIDRWIGYKNSCPLCRCPILDSLI